MLLRSLLIALFRNTKLVSQNLTNGIPNELAHPRSPRVWRLGVPGSGENMPFSSSGPQVQMPSDQPVAHRGPGMACFL